MNESGRIKRDAQCVRFSFSFMSSRLLPSSMTETVSPTFSDMVRPSSFSVRPMGDLGFSSSLEESAVRRAGYGVIIRPKKKIVPSRLSRIRNRNG